MPLYPPPATSGGTVTDFSAGDLSPLFTTTEATTTTIPALSFALTSAAATTVFGRAAGTSGAPTYSASPQFTAIGNLTTNGFVKTTAGTGTLSVDATTYLSANQNISLTGDVTGGPAATSIATTIGANKVTLGMMATLAADSVIGNTSASTATPVALTSLPWAYTGDVTRAADSNATVLAAGNAGNLNSGTLLAARMPAFTGDVTSAAGATANTLVNIPATTTIAGVAGTRGDVLYYGASGWAKLGAGTSGNQLTTNGAGADPTWAAPGSGGGGTPGGSTTQVQFNDAGAFGGDADLTWDKTGNVLATTGKFSAPSGSSGAPSFTLRAGGAWGDSGIYDPFGYGLAFVAQGSIVGAFINTYLQLAVPVQFASAGVGSATDAALARNAAGVVEVNNGTAGTYRDLKLRNLILSGGTQIPAASPTGLFLKDDGTYATPAGGAAGAGGSNTQVQYNTSGTLAGASGMTWDGTALTLSYSGANALYLKTTSSSIKQSGIYFFQSATPLYSWITDPSSLNIQDFAFYDHVWANSRFYIPPVSTSNAFILAQAAQLGWANSSGAAPYTADTALARNAAGVVEVNNGTAGTYRDLKARTVNVTSDFQINGTSVAGDYINSSVSSQTPSTSDVYLTGSNVTVPAGGFKVKGQYRCIFDVVKSAGTGTIVLTLRIGTAGTTADTSRITFTFPAGTSVADTGNMEVAVNWRTVGSGTTAVVSGFCRAAKNTITAAGLWNDTSAAKTIVGTVSGGFDSSAATSMGLSFNGGTAFAGTITTVQATLNQ